MEKPERILNAAVRQPTRVRGPFLAHENYMKFIIDREVTREEVKEYKRALRIMRRKNAGKMSPSWGTPVPFVVKVSEEVYSSVLQFGRGNSFKN